MINKPRVVKDYDKLDAAIKEQIKLSYPWGFQKHLVTFKNAKGQTVSALPFEAEDKYYLVRMTVTEAREIIEEDDDFDLDGNLKDDVRAAYEDKYDDLDLDPLGELPDEDDEDDLNKDDKDDAPLF